MKLQPIESAPKDGSEILTFSFDPITQKRRGASLAYWAKINSKGVWVGLVGPPHWCPLPTLEEETEAGPIHLSQAHINALTKDLAKKHDEIDSLTTELQAVKAERDSLRAIDASESLVYRLCLILHEDEDGGDPHEMVYEGSPGEPWGEAWLRYKDDSENMLSAVNRALALPEDVRVTISTRCAHCDGTGDVHNMQGEWLGECACSKGETKLSDEEKAFDAAIGFPHHEGGAS